MGKVIKMQKDPFKEVTKRQDEPPRPKTLGEPVESIKWKDHEGQEIEYYTIIEGANPKDPTRKQAFVYRPNPGMLFRLYNGHHEDLIYPSIAVIDTANGVIANMFPAGTVSFIQFKKKEKK